MGGLKPYKETYKTALDQLLSLPAFMSGYQLMLSIGEDPNQFILEGKQGKKAMKADPAGWVPLGGKQYFDIKSFMKAQPGFAAKMQEQSVKELQNTYELLAKTPAYAGIFGDAAGNFSPEFSAAVDQGFGLLGQQAVNMASTKGFMSDPNMQAMVLGPLAIQKAQYLKGVKDAAQQTAWGLAGSAGSAGTIPFYSYTAPNPMSYVGPLMNSVSMQQQFALQEAAMEAQKKQFNKQFYGDVFGSLAGMGMGMYGMGQQMDMFNQWMGSMPKSYTPGFGQPPWAPQQ